MKWLSRIALLLAVLLASTHLIIGAAVLVARWQDHEVIVVTGGSMAPTFNAGDVILVDQDRESLRAGDIVTFRSNQGMTTHRIVSFHTVKGVEYVRTKGDANAEPDPDFSPLDAVVGRVGHSYPSVGYAMAFLSTRMGVMLSLCPLLLYIFIFESIAIMRIWRETEESAPAPRAEVAEIRTYEPRHRLA